MSDKIVKQDGKRRVLITESGKEIPFPKKKGEPAKAETPQEGKKGMFGNKDK